MKREDGDEWLYEITDKEVSEEPVLHWFRESIQPRMDAISDAVAVAFRELALQIVHGMARSPERTLALRKLVEAQDQAGRAFGVTPR